MFSHLRNVIEYLAVLVRMCMFVNVTSPEYDLDKVLILYNSMRV